MENILLFLSDFLEERLFQVLLLFLKELLMMRANLGLLFSNFGLGLLNEL
jgi:hypothetical protein